MLDSCYTVVIVNFHAANFVILDPDDYDRYDGKAYCEFDDGHYFIIGNQAYSDPTPCFDYFDDQYARPFYDSFESYDYNYLLSLDGAVLVDGSNSSYGRIRVPIPDVPSMIRYDVHSCYRFFDWALLFDYFTCSFTDDLSWLRRFLGG